LGKQKFFGRTFLAEYSFGRKLGGSFFLPIFSEKNETFPIFVLILEIYIFEMLKKIINNWQ